MFRKIYKKIRIHLIGYGVIIIFTLVFLAIRFTVGTVVAISGTSMWPTFDDGDFVYGLIVYDNTELNVGDVVMVKEGDRILIKRIHGTPGQTIENHEITPPIPQTTLGDNEYYVVGDNYNNSHDSRMMGPVQRGDILFKYAGIRWRGIVELCVFFVAPLILFTLVLTVVTIPQTLEQDEKAPALNPTAKYAGKEVSL